MKYILSLLTIALFCTATTVSAAFTYEIQADPYRFVDDLGEKTGYYFKVAITNGSGKIYITDFHNSAFGEQSEVLTASDYGISSYGAYVYKNGVKINDRTVTHSLNDESFITDVPSEFTLDIGGQTYTYSYTRKTYR